MKEMIVAFLFLLIPDQSFALANPGEVLYSVSDEPKQEVPQAPEQIAKPKRQKESAEVGSESGNLPSEYSARNPAKLTTTKAAVIVPNPNIKKELRLLPTGSVLKALIPHSIIAFPEERAPVIAEILENESLRTFRLIGESRLEPNSKRIFIEFQKIVRVGEVYNIKASGLTSTGQPGFVGVYYSREKEYFLGDFLSSMVAGYFDGLVPRHRNVYGHLESDTSVDSAVKKGIAAGAVSSAERFREKLKTAPQFSELRGPIEIRVLVLESGVEK